MKHLSFSTKKIAALAAMTALSLGAFLLESLLPPLFFPGAKAGLSNVFSLLALLLYGPVEAALIVLLKTALGSVFAGNVSAFLYSFTAGEASILFTACLWAFFPEKLSLLSVSVGAAVVHNMTQLFVYRLLTGTPLVYAYVPYLALLGVLSGAIVGAIVQLSVKGIPMPVFERLLYERIKDEER